jgi:hypothetical protein
MSDELTLRTYLGARYLGRSLRPLEQAIAPDGHPATVQNLAALATRYKHIADELVEMFGGPDRVLQHYRSLRECQRRGRHPVSDRDAEEQFLDETYGAADLLRSGGPVDWVLAGDYYGECDRSDG